MGGFPRDKVHGHMPEKKRRTTKCQEKIKVQSLKILKGFQERCLNIFVWNNHFVFIGRTRFDILFFLESFRMSDFMQLS